MLLPEKQEDRRKSAMNEINLTLTPIVLDARRHYLVLGDYETEPSGDDCTYVLLPDSRLNLTQPEQLPGNGIIREAGLTTSVETGMRLLPLNGHIKQAELQQAITILQNQYQDLRVLGSCPQNLTEF